MLAGIQYIDCAGLNLLGGSTPQIKTGLYAKFKKALDLKIPIVATNCIYGTGHPMTPISIFAQQEDAHTIIGTASILQVVVTDEDSVTIQSLIPNNESKAKK